jgi:hypothetical protein
MPGNGWTQSYLIAGLGLPIETVKGIHLRKWLTDILCTAINKILRLSGISVLHTNTAA